ncbi:MAG: hypothetical protein IT422_13580 [Pirellulaceae bacterium]|nr:hypothetical protein [Pirellulaceae bacterium]
MFNQLYEYFSRHALASGCRNQGVASAVARDLEFRLASAAVFPVRRLDSLFNRAARRREGSAITGENCNTHWGDHECHRGLTFQSESSMRPRCAVKQSIASTAIPRGPRAFPATKRGGVTVLEVLFATGIAVFGMVGVASLLAVAGRQASDANNWSEGQAAAQNALSDFVVRGYTNSAWWFVFNDLNAVSFPAQFENYSGAARPRGTSSGGFRTLNRHAVCIDPYFFSDPTTVENLMQPVSTFSDTQIYRPGLFPYYQDNFNPLNPSATLPSGNAARLLRVGLKRNLSDVPPRPLSSKATDRQFQLLDDLAITTDDDDKTLPSERIFSSGAAQGLTKGEYSWFATLCPREVTSGMEPANTILPENLFTLSVVVCKRRDRAFYLPARDAGGMQIQQSPVGERVVTVVHTNADGSPIANFKGGSGGRVVLTAAHDPDDLARDISDSLRTGDWVMLCKESLVAGAGLMTKCRWYRVLTLDIETDIASGVWSRSVVLDGPDWEFDTSGNYPTQATLVSGVVTVVERVIPVR